MDDAELTLIRTSFEAALADTPAGAVPETLAALGWGELRRSEPRIAVAELFEAQGRLLAATPMLDAVVAEALSVELPAGTAIVHPEIGSWEPPARRGGAEGEILVDGLVLAGPERAECLLVPQAAGDDGAAVLSLKSAEVVIEPVAGFDERMALARVRARVAGGPPVAAAAPWEPAVAAAQRALAHELCGLAQRMLETAARHVTDRHQFGKPIAAFQTVRHRLTEVHVAIAAARPVLDAAWATDQPLAARAAKALAGRAGETAARHCLQVTGAIGFTWEYELHHQIRRTRLLDGLYGTARSLRARIGTELLARGAVPRIQPLP